MTRLLADTLTLSVTIVLALAVLWELPAYTEAMRPWWARRNAGLDTVRNVVRD